MGFRPGYSTPGKGRKFSLRHTVRTDYALSTGGIFPQGLRGRSVKIVIHLRLVPRLQCVDVLLHSTIYLHVVVPNSAQGRPNLVPWFTDQYGGINESPRQNKYGIRTVSCNSPKEYV